MRKVLVTFVLALTGIIMAQANVQQPADSQANTPTNQKVIKDPAEYNAYMTALNTQDPAQKAAAMEAFVNQYPQSVVRPEALAYAMAGYQQSGNLPKAEEVAKKILANDPNDVRVLAFVTFLDRGRATNGDANALKEGCEYAKRGLQAFGNWTKPSDMAQADFDKLRSQVSSILEGASGFCALQSKDYAAAREHYTKAVKIDPNSFQDVYQLAIADLEMSPMDKTGFWYIAKAYALAPAAAKAQIATYGKGKYRKYHGNYDGWDQFLASVATQTAPPANIPITPAPSPQEVACKLVQENDPNTLSIGDLEYVLQYRDAGPDCNKDAAAKAWQAVLNKQKDPKGDPAKLKINVKVISSSSDSFEAAITEENQQANKADLHVVMEKPMVKPPAAGTLTDVIGSISAYTPSPFMFTMTQAELPAAAKPPARKPPVKKPGAAKKKK